MNATRKRSAAQNVICQTLRLESDRIVNYSYLLYERNSRGALLVDPAWNVDKIESTLSECGCHLQAILLTHHHGDHVNKADELATRHRINVYMSLTEIHLYGFQCSNLVPLLPGKLTIGDLSVETIPTPGHTRGSVCFLIGNNLLTGDTLFIEGCGLCNESATSANDMYSSLEYLNNTVSDTTRVYPGHRFRASPGATMREVRAQNRYLNISRSDFLQRSALRHNHARQFNYL